MPKVSQYFKTVTAKDGDKDKNNKLTINNEKLLEKYKPIWTKIEDIKSNTLPVYDDRCIKTKIKTSGNKFYVKFRGLNKPEDDTK